MLISLMTNIYGTVTALFQEENHCILRIYALEGEKKDLMAENGYRKKCGKISAANSAQNLYALVWTFASYSK